MQLNASYFVSEYQGTIKKTVSSQSHNRKGSFDSWVIVIAKKLMDRNLNFYVSACVSDGCIMLRQCFYITVTAVFILLINNINNHGYNYEV